MTNVITLFTNKGSTRHGICKTFKKINRSSQVCLTKEPRTKIFILITSALDIGFLKIHQFLGKKGIRKRPRKVLQIICLMNRIINMKI